MKLLLELSMECEPLARAEALAALETAAGPPDIVHEREGVLVVDTRADGSELAWRAALCHYVSEWLGSCPVDEAEGFASSLDVEGPIRVRSTKVGVPEERVDLAALSRRVGGVLGKTRGVDLHAPRSDIRIVVSGRAHFGRVLGAVDRKSYESRKNRHLPFKYPASLHPKYARALVNLTRVREGDRLLDPFCGTGAIMAEASMLGLKAIGTDISQRMTEGARRNLSHLGLKADTRECDVGDIVKAVGRVDGIATDPPYGRSTSTNGERIPDLYTRAFDAFAAVLPKDARAAVVLPDPATMERPPGFRLAEKYPLWVHRSLTRHFCVFIRI